MIDLGSVKSVSRVELENSWCPYDYPRSYRVSVSDDGESWSDPVVEGDGTQSITCIALPCQDTRFIKIEQTGAHEKYWWSIADLRIYA